MFRGNGGRECWLKGHVSRLRGVRNRSLKGRKSKYFSLSSKKKGTCTCEVGDDMNRVSAYERSGLKSADVFDLGSNVSDQKYLRKYLCDIRGVGH